MTFMPLNTFQASSDLILTWPHFLTRTLSLTAKGDTFSQRLAISSLAHRVTQYHLFSIKQLIYE